MRTGGQYPKEPKLELLWGQMASWNMSWWRNRYNGNYRRCRIFGRTLPQNLRTTVTSVQHRNAIPKFTTMLETCLKPTSDVNKAIKNIFGWNMFPWIMSRLKTQLKTMDLSTRLWGINTDFVGFIPRSLVLRSIVFYWLDFCCGASVASVAAVHNCCGASVASVAAVHNLNIKER